MHRWKTTIISTTLISLLLIGGSFGSSADASVSISDPMRQIIDRDGVEAAICEYHKLRETSADSYNFSLAELDQLAADFLRENKQEIGLALSRLAADVYPDSINAQMSTAQRFHLAKKRDEARRYITRACELDSLSLMALVQKKRICFVPLDFEPPLLLTTERFLLRPLTAADAELDYKAVMSSVDHLTGAIGRRDWPGNLTLEEDRDALAGHEREFEVKEAFVYTVMNLDQTECLGCVYIYPSRWDDHDAEVVMWVSQSAFDEGLDPILQKTVEDWLAVKWPFEQVVYPGREVTWGEYFERLGRQDEHRHW